MKLPKIIYAGNRYIGISCLKILIENDIIPIAILAPGKINNEFDDEIQNIIKDVPLIKGKNFKDSNGLKMIKMLSPDYIISVHFPYIFPPELLNIPQIGTLNLHPAFLPYNKGWNTPTWSIIDNTPFGCTLHWVDSGIDTGDIALRKEINKEITDTADLLYKKAVETEEEIFRQAICLIKENRLPRIKQREEGTFHKKINIKNIQKVVLTKETSELINKIRALTTNKIEEASYFEENSKKYYMIIKIVPEEKND